MQKHLKSLSYFSHYPRRGWTSGLYHNILKIITKYKLIDFLGG